MSWKDTHHLVRNHKCIDPSESWKSIPNKSVRTLYNLYTPVLPVLKWEKNVFLGNDLFMTTFAKILNEAKRVLVPGGSVVFPVDKSWAKNLRHIRALPFAKPFKASFVSGANLNMNSVIVEGEGEGEDKDKKPTHFFVFRLPTKNLTRKK
jgi:hypothetical protein